MNDGFEGKKINKVAVSKLLENVNRPTTRNLYKRVKNVKEFL